MSGLAEAMPGGKPESAEGGDALWTEIPV